MNSEIENIKNLLDFGVLFQSKETRDKVFKELKDSGVTNIKKSSIRNQQLHPQYVYDIPENTYKTGFGNTDYNTFFSVLYEIKYKF